MYFTIFFRKFYMYLLELMTFFYVTCKFSCILLGFLEILLELIKLYMFSLVWKCSCYREFFFHMLSYFFMYMFVYDCVLLLDDFYDIFDFI